MEDPDELIKEIEQEFSSFMVNPSDFSQIRLIGKGGYAEVWLARNKRTNEEVAMKQLFTTLEPKQIMCFAREVKTMASANHPYFLKFLGFSTARPLVIITEYIPNGSLFQFLRSESRRERLTPTHRTLIAMSIASAMESLHKLGIIHRDLKSLNILLDKDLLPRLGDFGIARYIDSAETVTMRLGTPHWMAPEMFKGDGYGPKVDVYSFGMLLYELLTNSIPWAGKDPTYVMRMVLEGGRPVLPKDAPKGLVNLIEMCWDENPKRRPKFGQIFEMFVNREVEFEGTEETGVSWMVRQLEKWKDEEKKQKKRRESQEKDRDERKKASAKEERSKRTEKEKNPLEYDDKKQSKNWYLKYASDDSEEEEEERRPRKKTRQEEKRTTSKRKRRDSSSEEFQEKKRKRRDSSSSEEFQEKKRKNKRRKSNSSDEEDRKVKRRKIVLSVDSSDDEDQKKRKNQVRRKTEDTKKLRKTVKIIASSDSDSEEQVKKKRVKENDSQIRRKSVAVKKPRFFDEEESDREPKKERDQSRPPPRPPRSVEQSKKVPAPGFRDPHSLDGSRHVPLTPYKPPSRMKDPLSLDGRRITFGDKPQSPIQMSRSGVLYPRQDEKPLPKRREEPQRNAPIRPLKLSVSGQVPGHFSPSAILEASQTPSPGRSVILKDLESLKNPRFRSELANAVVNVTDAQREELTDILGQYFRAETPVREMDYILSKICVLVKNPKSATSFVYHNLHLQLPFDQEELVDRCFDIVLILFQTVPALFHEEYVGQLRQMIQISPQKAIVILGYYAQAFTLIKGPFPILDLMLSSAKTFFRANVGAELISVLFYLCSSFESYKAFRVTECIQQVFVKGLDSKDVETIKMSYYSLHHHFLNSVSLDPVTLTNHLIREETADAALDFLVKLREIPATDEMISAIIALGYYEERATLILIRLARNLDWAIIICRDQRWVASRFPTLTHTLQLFLVLFSHEQLRSTIQTWPETLSLIDGVCREQDSMKLAAVAIIIRQIGVTRQFMKLLVSKEILKIFLESAKAIDDPLAQKSALKVLETLGNVDFAPEYLMYADKIKQLLSLQNHTSALAVTVITTLSRYPLCAKKFVDLKLESYFRKLENNATYRNAAKEFLKNISVQEYY